jgi:hypothetical protein
MTIKSNEGKISNDSISNDIYFFISGTSDQISGRASKVPQLRSRTTRCHPRPPGIDVI